MGRKINYLLLIILLYVGNISPLLGGIVEDFFNAIVHGDSEQVQKYCDIFLTVNLKNSFGLTALMEAVIYNHAKIVEILLQHNANVNDTTRINQTALIFASSMGRANIVELLLQHGANVNDLPGRTALRVAVINGHAETVKLLLQYGAHIPADTREATIIHAARLGHAEIVKKVIHCGVNLNTIRCVDRLLNQKTPLIFAAEANHAEVVKVLLLNGAEIRLGLEQKLISHMAATNLKYTLNSTQLLIEREITQSFHKRQKTRDSAAFSLLLHFPERSYT